MKLNKENTKTILKAIAGILTLPIVLALFTLDRIILVALPHIKHETFRACLMDLKLFQPILYRIFGVAALYGLYSLILYIIS